MASPASSPRLPSPPPMAEDQISPSASLDSEYGMLPSPQKVDQDASRRIRPGTKAEDMHEGPPLIEFQQIDSAFQLTEHLKALHNAHTQSCSIALDKATAQSLAQPPPGVDRGIWLYELCRFLTQKANLMAIGLFADDPPCSATTCPEMRASEWQYLCAAHEPPKSCCAIDYCCHTLDWCATALTSTKLFPSRLGLGTEAASAQVQIRKMTEVFRRVYRIFAHAWFSHRDVFWRVESKTGLYLLFKTVCDEYRLIPEDNYTIPPEAEGIENTPTAPRPTPTILQRDGADGDPAGNSTLATGNTTKRHRHTMSDRAASISTVIHEEVEEEDDGEQPTGTLPYAAPELTRVETVQHADDPAAQQSNVSVEEPPPYPEDSTAKEAEKSDSPATQPNEDIEAETEPGSASEPTQKADTEQGEIPTSDPPSYADITSTTAPAEGSPTDNPPEINEKTAEESPGSTEVEENLEKNTEESAAEEAESKPDESETSATEKEEKDISEPMEPTEADAADETEASKTVAD